MAIVDDMGAVAIISLAYTDTINAVALIVAGAILAVMIVLNRRGETRLWPYPTLAASLWLAVLLSGVHATIAGVLAAVTIPVRRSPGTPDAAESPLDRLERMLYRPVAFFVVPLFGFANAGVALGGVGREQLLAPITLAIAAGLFVGKQIGIFGALRLAVALGIAKRPRGASWLLVYGVALLCGIGFTMSLFIGGLAFTDTALAAKVKIGVLSGSVAAALCGFAVLRLAPARR